MAWPTQAVSETNLDAGTDSPASARADLLQAVKNSNDIRTARDAADGVAGLGADGRLLDTDYVAHKGSGLLYESSGYNIPNGAGAFMEFGSDSDAFGGIINRVADPKRLTIPVVSPTIKYVRVGFSVYFFGDAANTWDIYGRLYRNGAVYSPAVFGFTHSPLGSTVRSFNAESDIIAAVDLDYFYLYISHTFSNAVKAYGRFWMEILE